MPRIENHKFSGIFTIAEKGRTSIATRSLIPNQSVYGEKVVHSDDGDYRPWAPRRSKLGAAIQKGITQMPIQLGSRVLYLGAASGTTVSHCSDIVGPKGVIYAVEFSARTARDLIQLAESRTNIVPIVDDARYPARYAALVGSPMDVVYQDLSQPDQARIFFENIKKFTSFGAWGMIAIKARSIDSTSSVDDIIGQEISLLSDYGLEIIENLDLAPLEKDHHLVLCRVTEGIM
ncbi:MAG: fibrillarin-like rRNA/tRNA 2'-O-methyltransferase [Candidatus Thorarchaeota archaeon]|nr:fibrillarin-like rRNA/tRNA 2'-O-methyltransferase [Candidatus Thorarchaeota archaeon]